MQIPAGPGAWPVGSTWVDVQGVNGIKGAELPGLNDRLLCEAGSPRTPSTHGLFDFHFSSI